MLNLTLTQVEHELMEIIWQLGEGTVNDVLAKLPKERKLAYTSVSTILRILQQKQVITAKKAGKKHIYVPLLSKKVFAKQSVAKVLDKVFAGCGSELVAYLLDAKKLSPAELDKIQNLLDEKRREYE
jgi:predicted transcriptional regulator